MNMKALFASVLFLTLFTTIAFQAQYVLAQEGSDPISSAISNVISGDQTAPVSSPISSDDGSNNSPISTPITSTEVDTTPVTTPISSPTTTPIPSPVTSPLTSPISSPITSILPVDLPNLIGNVFLLAQNAVGNITDSINVISQVVINVISGVSTNAVSIPQNTLITRVDGQTFDVSQLTSNYVSPDTILAPSNTNIIGSLQWGLVNKTLQFSNPITISIYVGNSYNGKTLSIYRSSNGINGWTTDGLASATCTVSNGVCSFQATKASYYATTQVAATTNTSNSTSSSNSSSPSSSSTSCGDTKPESAPVLLSAKETGLNQVTLTWSKASGSVTYYLVAYGTKSGVLTYGNPNAGDSNTTSVVINLLPGGQKYYFRVRAGNGCTPGDFSNEISVYVGGSKLSQKAASGFTQGVLGDTTIKQTKNMEASHEGSVQIKASSEASTKGENILQKIINFFKSIFGK